MIIPDNESLEKVEREHPGKTDAQQYRLAQADTLLRLTKAKDLDELDRMAQAQGGSWLDQLIEANNEQIQREQQ